MKISIKFFPGPEGLKKIYSVFLELASSISGNIRTFFWSGFFLFFELGLEIPIYSNIRAPIFFLEKIRNFFRVDFLLFFKLGLKSGQVSWKYYNLYPDRNSFNLGWRVLRLVQSALLRKDKKCYNFFVSLCFSVLHG